MGFNRQPHYTRGLMLLDGQEHLLHRRIMQEAFTRPRLEAYQGRIETIIARTVPTWPTDEPMLMYPAVKSLSLDVATETHALRIRRHGCGGVYKVLLGRWRLASDFAARQASHRQP